MPKDGLKLSLEEAFTLDIVLNTTGTRHVKFHSICQRLLRYKKIQF